MMSNESLRCLTHLAMSKQELALEFVCCAVV